MVKGTEVLSIWLRWAAAQRRPTNPGPAASNPGETIATVDTVDDLLPLQPAVFHILMVLAEEDRHGYAIIQAIAERTERRVRMGAGTLYRSLHRMLDDGLVVEIDQRPRPEDDDERRRYYRITPLGRKAARAEAQRLADLVSLARASGLAPRKV